MKVLVIIAVILTLVVAIDCRHVKGNKKSEIVNKQHKRQYDPYNSGAHTSSTTCCQQVSPPIENCCQAPHPPTCCTQVPDYTTVQGCCGTTVQPQPNCCQQPNPPSCCLNLHLKAGEQKNISTTSHGQNFILSVKLIPVDNPCTTAAPTTSPTPTPTGSTPTGSTPTGSTSTSVTSGSTTGGPGTIPPAPFNQCQMEAIQYHNAKRAIHNSPQMELDPVLNEKAKALAVRLASSKVDTANKDKRENNKSPVGLNFGRICLNILSTQTVSCKEIVAKWYSEVHQYDFKSPAYYDQERHFTQLVWKASTKLGIAMKSFEIGSVRCFLLVGVYKEKGNIAGRFPTNVVQGSFTHEP